MEFLKACVLHNKHNVMCAHRRFWRDTAGRRFLKLEDWSVQGVCEGVHRALSQPLPQYGRSLSNLTPLSTILPAWTPGTLGSCPPHTCPPGEVSLLQFSTHGHRLCWPVFYTRCPVCFHTSDAQGFQFLPILASCSYFPLKKK